MTEPSLKDKEAQDWEKKMFDAFWEEAKAWLIETGQYDDFIEWQKKHGIAAPKDLL